MCWSVLCGGLSTGGVAHEPLAQQRRQQARARRGQLREKRGGQVRQQRLGPAAGPGARDAVARPDHLACQTFATLSANVSIRAVSL